MSATVPVQAFQIGDRVRAVGGKPFVIRSIYCAIHTRLMYSDNGSFGFLGDSLTLAPERPPYVPSERRVVRRAVTIARYQHEIYRCETDAELAARHTVERAEYDRPRPADPVIYNAIGESIGITGRTSLDVPGAA